MEFTLNQKYELIKSNILLETSKNPIEIVKHIMHRDYINIHGPEHHYLDGAAFLMAYQNAGGKINIHEALDLLQTRSSKMPGAMCGFWGVCGSITSIGASLAIIHHTGPLSDDEYYKQHMQYTSSVIQKMSEIGGPRCCKRNAFLSLIAAAQFVKENDHIFFDLDNVQCEFHDFNQQCIKQRCPFYK